MLHLVDNHIKLMLYHKYMAPPKGYKMSDENKLKRSLALKGRKRPFMIGNTYNLGNKSPITPERLAFLKVRKPWNKGKGFKTKLTERIRGCFLYRQWRSDVFTRDGFTCIECGQRGGYLEADHIKQLALIVKENKLETLGQAENCAELWNINNGRTMCRECHMETDTHGAVLSPIQIS